MVSTFKYAEKRFSESLLTQGGVRIGTLYDFRNSEHKTGIADSLEGKKYISHHIPYSSSEDVNSIHTRALSEYNVISYDEHCTVIAQDCYFSREVNHPDMYVHCTSKVYSRKAASQFEGVDSCVEITDLLGFYRDLTKALCEVVPVKCFLGACRVRYTEREQLWNGVDWDEATNPALIKDKVFFHQAELRACWLPIGDDQINPVILQCPDLVNYCVPREMPLY